MGSQMKKTRSKKTTRSNTARTSIALATVAVALLAVTPIARSDVFHSARGLLATHFSASDAVSFVRVRPEGAVRQRVEHRLGRPLADRAFVFYHASTGDSRDGYAFFDSERGQHELIDIGTFFDADGDVTRVEVLAFREPYGDAVRSQRFLRQFVGRDSESGYRVGRDIDAISGATISARSLSRAVRRASVLLEEAVLPADRGSLASR